MRLPVLDGDPAQIDEAKSTRLLRAAIDGGVNYVDTAYPDHGGQSEPFVGRALKDGYRNRVQLATKCPTWAVQAEADWERYLDEQLGRLQTDRVDFYLLHALSAERWETVKRCDGLRLHPVRRVRTQVPPGHPHPRSARRDARTAGLTAGPADTPCPAEN
jgi:predicted aldo/keto reductase-like oxidoreductase